MSKLNEATLLQKASDIVNRVPPYNDPLIQKAEYLELEEDEIESSISKIPTQTEINNPGGTINIDFTNSQEYLIDTTASLPSSFALQFSGLDGNVFGKVSITKNPSDDITFGNATIAGGFSPVGENRVDLIIFISNGNYHAIHFKQDEVFEWITPSDNDPGVTISTFKYRKYADGRVQFRGTFLNTISGFSGGLVTILPEEYRPIENLEIYLQAREAENGNVSSNRLQILASTGRVTAFNVVSGPSNFSVGHISFATE